MKKYSIIVTIIALAELVYILSGGVGSGPEKYTASTRSAAVVSATVAPRATATPKSSSITRQYTAPRATATPRPKATATPKPASSFSTYILNTNSKVFHKPSCSSVKQMLDKNKQTYNGPRTSVINMGYKPCGRCHP